MLAHIYHLFGTLEGLKSRFSGCFLGGEALRILSKVRPKKKLRALTVYRVSIVLVCIIIPC